MALLPPIQLPSNRSLLMVLLLLLPPVPFYLQWDKDQLCLQFLQQLLSLKLPMDNGLPLQWNKGNRGSPLYPLQRLLLLLDRRGECLIQCHLLSEAKGLVLLLAASKECVLQ